MAFIATVVTNHLAPSKCAIHCPITGQENTGGAYGSAPKIRRSDALSGHIDIIVGIHANPVWGIVRLRAKAIGPDRLPTVLIQLYNNSIDACTNACQIIARTEIHSVLEASCQYRIRLRIECHREGFIKTSIAVGFHPPQSAVRLIFHDKNILPSHAFLCESSKIDGGRSASLKSPNYDRLVVRPHCNGQTLL